MAYLSADAMSLNTLVGQAQRLAHRVRDPTVTAAWTRARAPRRHHQRRQRVDHPDVLPRRQRALLRLELGEREDAATVSVDIPTTLLGGPGADKLTGRGRASPGTTVTT